MARSTLYVETSSFFVLALPSLSTRCSCLLHSSRYRYINASQPSTRFAVTLVVPHIPNRFQASQAHLLGLHHALPSPRVSTTRPCSTNPLSLHLTGILHSTLHLLLLLLILLADQVDAFDHLSPAATLSFDEHNAGTATSARRHSLPSWPLCPFVPVHYPALHSRPRPRPRHDTNQTTTKVITAFKPLATSSSKAYRHRLHR